MNYKNALRVCFGSAASFYEAGSNWRRENNCHKYCAIIIGRLEHGTFNSLKLRINARLLQEKCIIFWEFVYKNAFGVCFCMFNKFPVKKE